MKLTSFLVLSTFCAAISTGSAQASPIDWTVSTHGKIDFGFDYAGVFGVAGQDLAGFQYTQTITAGTIPNDYAQSSASPNRVYLSGKGSIFTDVVTVNGRTAAFAVVSPFSADQTIANGLSGNSTTTNFDSVGSFQYGFDSIGNLVTAHNAVSTHLPDSAFVPLLSFTPSIQIDVDQTFFSYALFAYTRGSDTFASFQGTPDSLAVNAGDAAPSTVPEPASTLLCTLGLLTMTALRLRREH